MNRTDDGSENLPEDDPLATADPLATYDPDLTTDQPIGPPGSFQQPPADAAFAVDETFAEEEQLRINEACGKFDSAWEEGDQDPNIEEHIPSDVNQGLQQAIVRQLLMLDISHREKRNKSLKTEEYLSRLSHCRAAVQSVMTQRGSSVPRGYGSLTVPTKGSNKGSKRAKPRHANDPTTRYRPMEFHARGGLGEVYRANDEELNRTVALKEILPDFSSDPRYQEKFVFEASVTGSLEHPGIVPVYGLGHYEDKQPYYAMRFIRGRSFRDAIREFHDTNPSKTADTYLQQDFRNLLRRLIDSCNALHYAHQHGVLHRDIKPDNIMLGKYGETLVVDWGLSQLMDRGQVLTSDEMDSVQINIKSGSRSSKSAVGTPMYMSPEQAHGRNDELDGRTDVYSLGAMLFNIITGQHPIEGKSGYEIVNNVRKGKVKSVNSLVPAAPKPLASICRRAMELDVEKRYASATELAEDIELWMSDEAVSAHDEGFREWMGRWLRRNRSWTFSIAAALILITLSTVIATLAVNRARKNELAAKQEATELYGQSRSAIDTWLLESSDTLEYFPGTQSVRARLLTLATEDYEKLASRSSRDPRLELERGRAVLGLGHLLQLQKNYTAAIRRYREALHLFQTPVAEAAVARKYRTHQAEAHRRIGLAFAEQNNTAEAKQEYESAIAQLKKLTTAEDDPAARRILATTQNNAGELEAQLGRSDSAIEYLQASLQNFSELGDGDADIGHALAETRVLLGRVHAYRGDDLEADSEFSAATEMLESLVRDAPDHPKYLDALASAYISHAESFRTRGLQKKMIASLERAAAHYRALRNAMPDVPRYEQNLAITLTDLGLGLHDDDLDQSAGQHLNEASELSSQLAEFYSQVPEFRDLRAASFDGVGQVLLETQPSPEEAIQMFATAIADYQFLSPQYADHPEYVQRLGVVQSHYAQALARNEQNEDAKAVFEASSKVLGQLIDAYPDVPGYENARAHVHYRYAQLLERLQDDEAESHFRSARDSWAQLAESGAARYSNDLAWLLATCPVDSVRNYTKAVEAAEKATELATDNARYRVTSSLAHLLAGEVDKAAEHLDLATELRDEPVGRDMLVLAMIQAEQGKQQAAEESLRQAIVWLDANQPFDGNLQRLRRIAERKVGAGREG